ncbi:unnamed protein product [Adineta ricciae]|uniref:CW-type domain-containing protein n=1 Tax=Adineta ricciae TaxID=249248 RepID=A0A814D392_ADIRI|nr:unnamed protein product [Adineta ricciae]CAF0950465.1 unnamed protein product [Adineta ricciae]
MNQYDCLNKAQLSFEYLHTNSTTHTFLFGALAELVDNSRDAGAKNLHIYTHNNPSLRGGFYLAFLDDGCGMHYDDVFNVIVFGKSAKRHTLDSTQIGQYGNGLKSGAMRIANDFILFTKKDNIGTCLFLSRTFHQEEHIPQIMCPMPCFDLTTRQPIENTDNQQLNGTHTYTYDKTKHELEMHLITKYSPFKTVDDLFKQFDLITSPTGTLIVLYNVKLSNTGEAELDIRSDPYDIVIDSKNRRNLFDDDDDSTPAEYRSLRAYVSILYYDPRMHITIQQRRVVTKKLPLTLYKPRQYQFKSTRFKTRSEQDIKQCEKDLVALDERIREADSQVHDAQQRIGMSTSADDRSRLRKLQIHAAELKDLANRLRNGLTRKKSELNTTKTLTFIFGLNVPNRAADGVFVYNCGRLIRMYEKIGQQNKKTLYCRGVIGVVDIPSIVLQPTHNKQAFADEKEYHFLLKSMGEYMRQYWSDAGIEQHVKEFWEAYGEIDRNVCELYLNCLSKGYRDDQLDRLPSNDPESTKRRQFATPTLIQCNKCFKWRRLPYTSDATTLTQAQPESWECSNNSDLLNNSCSANEKLEAIPEGELKQKTSETNNQTRAATTNLTKRISNAEISSTTNHNTSKPITRSSIAPVNSILAQKRVLSTAFSSASNTKRKKKPKRQILNSLKPYDATSDDDETSSSEQPSYSYNSQMPLSDFVTSTKIEVVDDDNNNNIENINKNEIVTDEPLPPPTIGARVWAMYQGARRPGQVLSVNDKREMFKMRFDEFPTAEFDYSFSYKSSAWSYIGAPPSQPSIEIAANDNEPLCTIAKKFKALIKFMLPPDWELTREQITSMSYDDLSQFDVTIFMQSYREKMTKIVEQRKADEARWRESAQRLKTEVTDLLNLSGLSIPNDCSMEDFQNLIQSYTAQLEKSS